jgi:thioredoxin 2
LDKILKFTSRTCGPCQGLNMTLKGEDLGLPIDSVDIDADPTVALEYGVRSVPTLILIRDGAEVSRMMGARPLEAIRTWAQQS